MSEKFYSTLYTKIIHFPTMVTGSILNLFNIQSRSSQIAPLDQTSKSQTAHVQFYKSNKSNIKKEFAGTLTFFSNGQSKTNASTKTVAYGQWHNIHDTNPLNYEFVIYKNGVMHKDLSVNIQRDLVIKKNEAKLLTTFDELDLDGSQSIIGGCVYLSVRGRIISKAKICKA
ncbi:10258_t:CDS:1 [Funneliformis geosporum]|uniref:9079_t:CDS:1 n=1 Tax=Funneliformis geosporum TaxID=1117311 RepID=A0A9W4SI95_9GLOM|nr:9079_t:CDS:1 [Funneliformis geosporum]CAI2172044.1 10258_t:CDS:1 [Funneliformis geosporum]